MRYLSFFSLVLLSGVVFAACSSNDDPPPNNGVNDVGKACALRAAWTQPTAEKCINCMAAAPEPKCDCEAFKEFGGLCESQEQARRGDSTCSDALDSCAHTCPANDCTCLDNCYAQAPSCKQLDGARDGCLTDVCAQYCN